MELNQTIAQNIVKRAMKIIGHSVNVMNKEGIIIASGNPARLQQKHIGAVLALRENKVVEVDETLARKWNFEAQPGINLPINYLGNSLGVVGISGVPEQVRPYAELVKMAAELIIEQHMLLEKQRWDQRYKEEFILQLIKGSLNTEQLTQQAKFFSFDLSQPRLVIIIKLLYPTVESLQELVNYLGQPQFKQHVAVLSLQEIVLLQTVQLNTLPLQDKQLKTLIPQSHSISNYKIAVSAYVPVTEKQYLARAYQTAQHTLNYGQKVAPKKTIYFFEKYKLPVLLNNLSDSWQNQELLKPLQKLQEQDHNQLLQKTLIQYFLSNCDLALTAHKLFIHQNTLRYRLKKIEALTSLSFNKIDEKFTLYLSTILQCGLV